MRKINTVRFGEIEVDEEKVIRCAEGIPAFESEHEFLVLPLPSDENDSPYVFLQSVNTPELAFLMTNPFIFFPDYEFNLEDDVEKELGINSSDDVLIYTLITIPGGKIPDMTANLMAPLVINQKNFKAKQVILEKGKYTTKHRLFKSKEDESK